MTTKFVCRTESERVALRRGAAPSAQPVAFSRATPSAAMYRTPTKRFLPATPPVHESIFHSRYLGRALDYPWFGRTFGGWLSLRWTARGVWTEVGDHDLRAAIDAMPLPTRFSRSHADFPAGLSPASCSLYLPRRTDTIAADSPCPTQLVSAACGLLPGRFSAEPYGARNIACLAASYANRWNDEGAAGRVGEERRCSARGRD